MKTISLIPTIRYLLMCLFISLAISCDNNAKVFQKIEIQILLQDMESIDMNRLKSDAKKLLMFMESEVCSDTIFLPKIIFKRLDFKRPKVDSLSVKLSWVVRQKMSHGTLTKTQLSEDYKSELQSLKLPSLLNLKATNTPKERDSILKRYKIDYKYNSAENKVEKQKGMYYSPESIIGDISNRLCDGRKTNFTILYNDMPVNRKENIDSDNEQTNKPCQTKNIVGATELKKEMMKIIDVSRSETERIVLANRLWNKYFTKNAYVAKHINATDNNPREYGPNLGQGIVYFRDRLARFESITDLNVIRLEYSLKDGQKGKIFGLHIVECHNSNK